MTQTRKSAAIDWFADLTCPWCYVGWAALKQAAIASADETSCSVAWRSFLLHPDLPTGGIDRKAFYAERFAKDPERASAARTALMQAAEAADAPLNLDAATILPNTTDAHRLIHWAAEAGSAEAAIDALFSAYFIEGRDIGDSSVLVEIGAALGLDADALRTRFATSLDADTVAAFHNAAVRIGVQGVPVAIVNRRAVLMGAESADAYGQAIRAAAV